MNRYVESRENGRIDLAASAPLPKPLAIYIEPTNICNFGSQCFFCPQHLPDYSKRAGYHQHITMPIVHKVIDDIEAMGGVKSIKLHLQGEGTLHPQIGEIARLACTVSGDVLLTTNGSRLDAKKSQELIEAGLHFIRISIYEETKPSVQSSILENVRTLRELRDAQGKSSPHIVAKWLSNNPSFGEWIKESYSDIADEFLFEGMRGVASAFIPAASLTTMTDNLTGDQVACTLPFYQMIIKANGDVAPCCQSWNQDMHLGNVMEDSLLDIWHGDVLAYLRITHLKGLRKTIPTCSSCDALWTNKDSIDTLSAEEYERRRKSL
jgi:radical SAM protein with 4Fe4S-binding SPASM domain